jgi:hypothetical protein
MSEMASERPGGRGALLTYLLPPAVLLVTGLLLFPVSGSDDKYITYWSAHAPSRLGELVNFNGDRVEQSSSLTHVVLLAGVAKMLPWLPMPALGWLLSVVSGVAAVHVTQRLAKTVDSRLTLRAGLMAGSATSLVYWSFGGLESTLAATLSGSAMLAAVHALKTGLTWKQLAAVGLVLLLFVGVRPEAIFVALAAWGGLLALAAVRHDRVAARRIAAILAVTIGAFAALTLFRYMYFDDFFPQPVHAKVDGPSLSRAYLGLRYFLEDPWPRWRLDVGVWLAAGVTAALALMQAFTSPSIRLSPTTVVAAFFGAQASFVVFSGGDWMEGARFLTPLVPSAAILIALTLARVSGRRTRNWILAAVLLTQFSESIHLARVDSPSSPLWVTDGTDGLPGGAAFGATWFDRKNRVHAHFIPMTTRLLEVLPMLTADGDRRVTVFSGQMGFVPYYVARKFYGRVRFIDKAGLVTRDVTAHPGASEGQRRRTGLNFSYQQLFALADDGNAADWIPPDVLFDYDLRGGPDGKRAESAERHGYVRAFAQHGFPPSRSAILRGRRRFRDEAFIEVRRELMPTALLQEGVEFNFQQPANAVQR